MAKKLLTILVITSILSIAGTALANSSVSSFSDVPLRHWAYGAVNKLIENGILDGYGAARFQGNHTVTRYEMAQIVENALTKREKASDEDKALIDKLAAEFTSLVVKSPAEEMPQAEAKKQKLKMRGQFELRYFSDNSKQPGYQKARGTQQFSMADYNYLDWQVNENTSFHAVAEINGHQHFGNTTGALYLTSAYVRLKDFADFNEIYIGRQVTWGLGNGIISRPFNSDGIKMTRDFGKFNFSSFIANINGPIYQEAPKQINPVLGTAQIGTRLTKDWGLSLGHYWSTVNGDYDGWPNGNFTTGSFKKSKGYDISTDYRLGKLLLFGEYVGTTLSDRYSLNGSGKLLPKNPKAWAIELTTGQVPLFYPIADQLFDTTKVGSKALSLIYYQCDPGALPPYVNGVGASWEWSYMTPGGYNVMDNSTGFVVVYSEIVAKNVKLLVSYWDQKFHDLNALEGFTSDRGRMMYGKLMYYY
jgi:hypothetical protein